MSSAAIAPLHQHAFDPTPVIECGVIGPHQQPGFLLRAPRLESLVWDLTSEIATTRQMWDDERDAWWIAASYLETAVRVVLRSFPSVLVLDEAEGDRLFSRDGRTMLQQRLL